MRVDEVIRAILYSSNVIHYPARGKLLNAIDKTFKPIVETETNVEETSEFLEEGNKHLNDAIESNKISAYAAESVISLLQDDIKLAETFCNDMREALIETEGDVIGFDRYIHRAIHLYVNSLDFKILTCYKSIEEHGF